MPPLLTRDRLQSVLRTRSGSLEETPYPALLLAMGSERASGVVRLARHQLEKTVVFDDGVPVECRSNIATEMLGRYLVSTGKVSQADCHAAFGIAASRGVPLGEILTERKLLTPTELYRALQQNLGRKLLEPFSWADGTYAISGETPPVASVLRVKVPQLLVTGVMKVLPQETADEGVAAANGKFLSFSPDPLFGLDTVRLTAEQQKVVETARRGAKLDDLRAAARLDADDVHRLLYALMLLGILTVTDKPVMAMPRWESKRAPAAAEPVVVDPSTFLAPVVEPEPAAVASADEVMAAYLSFRRKDAFELLGLEENAEPAAIPGAYLNVADRFLPSKFDERAADGLREKAQDVFLAAARAYAELADPERRAALVRKREKLREHAAAAAQAGQAALIDPEVLCQSGRTLAAAGKLREALSSFELAAECDVQNGTYAAEAIWCRYQLRITPPANALKLLKNALRIDPNSGVAYLYAGQVQGALGNRLEAEAYLSRAATLLPGDPRPAAASKALR